MIMTNNSSAIELPRTLPELRRFLHSYRIRMTGNQARTARASIVYGGIEAGKATPMVQWAARELAEMDPELAWLPTWKPRVTVAAKGAA